MEILIIWLVFSGLVGVVANNKGHSAILYAALAMVASPLIGILVVLALKPNVKAVEQAKIEGGENKKCPYCAEIIKAEASVCRFCGRDLPMKSTMRGGLPATGAAFSSPGRRSEQTPGRVASLPGEPIYHVSRGGLDLGAMPVSRIRKLIDRGELVLDEDYYFDPGMQRWSTLVDLV